MTDNRTTELESLSKLKMAGRLRYWRGTIEIPESELHAICDEIQAEYDRAVAAMNKAAGNWAKADALLRERMSGTLTAEQVREAISADCDMPDGGRMSLCEHCHRATFNGFPLEGSPEWEVGTIWFWCPTVDTHFQRFLECECHIEGEPRRFDKRGKEL